MATALEVIELKTAGQLQIIREAGRVVGETLRVLREATRPGVTTEELDTLARRTMDRLNGVPAFKGYRGFPAHICTSVNDQVVHGVPSSRRLEEGDIVGLDVGVMVDGYYADAALTAPVGRISPEAERLLQVTRGALAAGIRMARPGGRISDISHAIQEEVESHGYSVVRDYVGHGIGAHLHEPPPIPNYGTPGCGAELKPGMVLAIEPMVNVGGPGVKVLQDGWTAVTKDGGLSAHFEHTVAITQAEPEILTLS